MESWVFRAFLCSIFPITLPVINVFSNFADCKSCYMYFNFTSKQLSVFDCLSMILTSVEKLSKQPSPITDIIYYFYLPKASAYESFDSVSNINFNSTVTWLVRDTWHKYLLCHFNIVGKNQSPTIALNSFTALDTDALWAYMYIVSCNLFRAWGGACEEVEEQCMQAQRRSA